MRCGGRSRTRSRPPPMPTLPVFAAAAARSKSFCERARSRRGFSVFVGYDRRDHIIMFRRGVCKSRDRVLLSCSAFIYYSFLFYFFSIFFFLFLYRDDAYKKTTGGAYKTYAGNVVVARTRSSWHSASVRAYGREGCVGYLPVKKSMRKKKDHEK